MATPRVPPRAVPTLTEVVHRTAAPVAAPAGAERAGHDRLIESVMQRLEADLDLRLREAIASMVLEQVQALRPRIRAELEDSVRRAVAEALREGRAPDGGGGWDPGGAHSGPDVEPDANRG